ncbi:hypothetical protein QU40_00295, partial [Staphylococcus aureus]
MTGYSGLVGSGRDRARAALEGERSGTGRRQQEQAAGEAEILHEIDRHAEMDDQAGDYAPGREQRR